MEIWWHSSGVLDIWYSKKAQFPAQKQLSGRSLRPIWHTGSWTDDILGVTPSPTCHWAKRNDFASKWFILNFLIYMHLFLSPNLFNDASAHLCWVRRSHVVNFGLTEGMVTWPRRLTGLLPTTRMARTNPGFCCPVAFAVYALILHLLYYSIRVFSTCVSRASFY